jgi:hypothetical protein
MRMMSEGSVRSAAKRRMRTKIESLAPSSVVMDLHSLRRMDEMEARRRTCSHVMMLFC